MSFNFILIPFKGSHLRVYAVSVNSFLFVCNNLDKIQYFQTGPVTLGPEVSTGEALLKISPQNFRQVQIWGLKSHSEAH